MGLSRNTINVANFSGFAGCFWLFITINPYISWLFSTLLLAIIAFLLMLLATYFNVVNSDKQLWSKSKLLFAIIISIYIFYLGIAYRPLFISMLFRVMQYFPLLFLLFWKEKNLISVYEWFRKLILFFAFGSLLLAFLGLIGVHNSIPHIEMEGMSNAHMLSQNVLKIYGFAVNSTISEYALFGRSVIMRAHGCLQEPGHFAIILGLLFIIDTFSKRKVNTAIVICGFLTFSPFFYFSFLLVALIKFSTMKNKKGVYSTVLVISLFFLIIFLSLSESTKEVLWYSLAGRNLEIVVETWKTTGSLTETLDMRTSLPGRLLFRQFSQTPKVWTGDVNILYDNETVVLSDYRGFILTLGIIGLVISLITAYCSLYNIRRRLYRFVFITILFLIYLHRSWMFYAPYIVTLCYLGSFLLENNFRKKSHHKLY